MRFQKPDNVLTVTVPAHPARFFEPILTYIVPLIDDEALDIGGPLRFFDPFARPLLPMRRVAVEVTGRSGWTV